MTQLRVVLDFIKAQYRRFLLTIFLAVALFLFLFPTGDLRDYITSQISFITGRSVYVNFDAMNINFVPRLGLSVEGLETEVARMSPLKMRQVTASPAVMGLLSSVFSGEFQPYGVYEAEGIFQGNLQAALTKGLKTENDVERMKVDVKGDGLSLSEVAKLAKLPMVFRGRLDLESSSQIDLTFSEQPDGSITLKIANFELPSSSIESMMGAVVTPQVNLKQVELTGRLNGGRFYIDRGSYGTASDELFGTIRGNIGLTMNNQNGRIFPTFGSYDFQVDMTMKPSFEQKGELVLFLIEKFKRSTENGSSFKFQMTGQNFFGPPVLRAL